MNNNKMCNILYYKFDITNEPSQNAFAELL